MGDRPNPERQGLRPRLATVGGDDRDGTWNVTHGVRPCEFEFCADVHAVPTAAIVADRCGVSAADERRIVGLILEVEFRARPKSGCAFKVDVIGTRDGVTRARITSVHRNCQDTIRL